MPSQLSAAAPPFEPLNTSMANLALSEGDVSVESPTETPNKVLARRLVREYFSEHLPIYQELTLLKAQGWAEPAGDTWFQGQRSRADNADQKVRAGFFMLMRDICLELDAATSALTIPRPVDARKSPRPAVLDLCMAPGGFTLAALFRNPGALVRGISLPPAEGGHDMLLRKKWSSTNPKAPIYVSFRDITLLADEMGVPTTTIPPSHPDASSFSSDRPFLGQQFDIVFCDGQVLRTHKRHEYRERCEATRLTTSQLVIALSRVRPGGTVIVLLHKADAWPSVLIAHAFSQFSTDGITLFKPREGHKQRSSYYLVARGVQPDHEAAREAVRGWKAKWKMATFGMGEARRRRR
ncbi:hypothetical protein QBC39DRAFT_127087 [Podospora conica]|nr:hypothetical protein QBC39DRAFT_127087 [Schizothecium conicum]